MYAKHVGGIRPHDTICYTKWLKIVPRTNISVQKLCRPNNSNGPIQPQQKLIVNLLD